MAFKDIMDKKERLAPGHRMCAGCGGTVAVRNVLRGLKDEDEAVITCTTGCLEVSSFIYPYTAWEDSFIHNAFENAAATCSGVESAYRAMVKMGKLDQTYKFIAFGGDGGRYDIGFQSLSGAMERNHDMVYVCYDNDAYMNTGIQHSSATPMYADTTTTPAGRDSDGKHQNWKDLTAIIAEHHIPYVAQTTFVRNFKDLHTKSEKAIGTPGAAFLNVMAPCPRGWHYHTEDLMALCDLAVESNYWPLYEVIEGRWVLNYEPKNRLPIEEFLKPQWRFKHMFKPGNEGLIERFQEEVDRRFQDLKYRCSQH
ncbi:thiamine pyrophosphate-dependent enzyme [Eubacterium aggregans]|uniref:thiamine pyrophosphate-dependent enzyme n=1 Tax=Eubacterium aggregans TaxID=81409 RepID=UPI003F33453D